MALAELVNRHGYDQICRQLPFRLPITVCVTTLLPSTEASEHAELHEAMDVSTYG